MRLNPSLKFQVEHLLAEAREARDPSTNGLLDRTDCLDLMVRLAAATQKLLAVATEAPDEREGTSFRNYRMSARLALLAASASGEAALTSDR